MKKFISVLLILLIILFLVGCSSKQEEGRPYYYALSAKVTTIDVVRNYVGFTDRHGIEWYWYSTMSDVPWELDKEVLLVMFNSGTTYIFDDELVSITFEGLVDCTVSK